MKTFTAHVVNFYGSPIEFEAVEYDGVAYEVGFHDDYDDSESRKRLIELIPPVHRTREAAIIAEIERIEADARERIAKMRAMLEEPR